MEITVISLSGKKDKLKEYIMAWGATTFAAESEVGVEDALS